MVGYNCINEPHSIKNNIDKIFLLSTEKLDEETENQLFCNISFPVGNIANRELSLKDRCY